MSSFGLTDFSKKKRSFHSGLAPANTVRITYVDPDGDETTVDADIGQNLLHVAHDNDIELEGMFFISDKARWMMTLNPGENIYFMTVSLFSDLIL